MRRDDRVLLYKNRYLILIKTQTQKKKKKKRQTIISEKFGYGTMKYHEFEQLLSPARIGRFARAMNHDRQKTILLYRYNIYLSQRMFGVMHIFEIALRNKIDAHYRAHFQQTDWLFQQSRAGGAFHGLRSASIIEAHYQKLLARNQYTHDRLISELSFGFWTTLFDRSPFRAGGQKIHTIFTDRPVGINQRRINHELDKIRQFRNRIAHHQPLCFNAKDEVDLSYPEERYRLILQYTHWLGYGQSTIYHGLDQLHPIFTKIEKLTRRF